MIVNRLESPSYEVAVFGRVSSGKSSLLNHIGRRRCPPSRRDTRHRRSHAHRLGREPGAIISFAESQNRAVGIEDVWEFASEEGNPRNQKHITNRQNRSSGRLLRPIESVYPEVACSRRSGKGDGVRPPFEPP